jgi:PAS domain S-box-containing protein
MDKGRELFGLRKHRSELPGESGLNAGHIGELDYVLSSVADLTQRKRAEERKERQFQLLADAMPLPVWMADVDGHIFWYNQRWYEYTGTSIETMRERGWQSVHDPAQSPKVLQQWQACIATDQPFEMMVPLRGKDGLFRTFVTRVVPIRDHKDRVERWFGTHTDITASRRAAAAEQLMIAAVESAEDAIVTKTLDGIVRSWNPAARLLLGYDAEEIIGESVLTLIPEDRRNEEGMILDQITSGQRVAHFETIRRRKDGSLVDVSLTISPIRDDQGVIVGASKIMRDITQRKKSDAALKKSHDRISIATEAAGQGFWEFNIETHTLVWDEQMFQLYGRSKLDGEQPYTLWADSLHPDDRERSERELVDAISGKRPFDTEFRIVCPNGAIRHIQSLARVTRNAQGRAVNMFGLNYDITERKHATEQMLALNSQLEERVAARTAALAATNASLAEKNEEVEAFVYIVSHDLRAPLVNIQGFSTELTRSCGELEKRLRGANLKPETEQAVMAIVREDISGALRYISASTTKFQRLIDTLLVLSRTGKQELQFEQADVQVIVETTLLSLRQAIQSSGAEVIVETLPQITADVTAIGQVFSNLISNALQYLQPGRPGHIVVGGDSSNGIAHYWVRDNGVGIAASAQLRLFRVFQRFHPDLASGDGMGLAIVKRIVERHGGRVWAESEVRVGTTFHLEVPTSRSP